MFRKLTGLSTLLLLTQTSIAAADPALDTVNSFEKLFGVTAGERRNHTKGYCFDAVLSPADDAIRDFSVSPLFRGDSRVTGRLSHKGGNARAADDVPAEYGMALAIQAETGSEHRMSMNTLDFFPVATPEAFAGLMRAKAQGKEAVKAFKAGNEDLQRFKAHNATKPKQLLPYEGSTYNSINSFYLIDENGDKTAVRWTFRPVQPQGVVVTPQQDFFFKNMQQNLAAGEVSWEMVVTLANPDDEVDNAALAWQGEHQEIVAATLTVTAVSLQQGGACSNINYDPLVLSAGFEPSADPLLQARRSSYAISFGRRITEQQSAY